VNHLDESIDLVRKTEGDSGVVADLVRIRGQLVDRMENTLGDHANEILSAISVELRGLEGGEGARIAATLGGDPQVKAGADLIRDIREYEKRLSYGMSRER